MRILSFTFIFYPLFCLSSCFKTKETHMDILSNFIPGFCLTSTTTFETIGPFGLIMCLRLCLSKQRCKAICYHRKQHTCMLGYDGAGVEQRTDENYIISQQNYLSSGQANQVSKGMCTWGSCPLGKTCFNLKNGDKQCIRTALYVCTPTPIRNAVFAPNEKMYLGMTITYTCNTGCTPSGDNTNTCGENGQWLSSMNLICAVSSCGLHGYVMQQSGMCAKIYENESLNYTKARWTCESDGGRLARIDSGTKGSSMMSYATPNVMYYSDGSDIQQEGNWIYEDGTPVTDVYLTQAARNIVENDCVLYDTQGLHSGLCDTLRPFICEILYGASS